MLLQGSTAVPRPAVQNSAHLCRGPAIHPACFETPLPPVLDESAACEPKHHQSCVHCTPFCNCSVHLHMPSYRVALQQRCPMWHSSPKPNRKPKAPPLSPAIAPLTMQGSDPSLSGVPRPLVEASSSASSCPSFDAVNYMHGQHNWECPREQSSPHLLSLPPTDEDLFLSLWSLPHFSVPLL